MSDAATSLCRALAVVAVVAGVACGGNRRPMHAPVHASPSPPEAARGPDRDETLVLVGRLRELFDAQTTDEAAAAAIDALTTRRGPAVIDVLVEALFALPSSRPRARAALVAQGAAAIPELRRVLRGEHTAVNARIAARLPASTDREQLAARLSGSAEREELAASVLGELHAEEATADLVAALERAHAANGRENLAARERRSAAVLAILRALAQIGDPEADDAIHRVWADRRSLHRLLALEAYGYVARDASAVPELWRLTGDKRLGDQALATIGQVADSDRDLARLRRLQRAARARWRAAFLRAEASPAAAELESAASAVERSLVVSVDGAMRPARGRFEAAERRRQRAIEALAPLEAASHAARERLLQLDRQIARVELAWRCQRRVPCLLASLSTPQDAAAHALALVPDAESGGQFDHVDARPLALAQIDRAMLELAKLAELPHARKTGAVAPAAAALRAALSCKPAVDCYSDDPGTREAILRALKWVEKPL